MNTNLRVIDKEDMHRQIVEYSFETTIIHSNQKVLYINQSGAEFLKESKDNIIGANIVGVFTEEYRDYIIERIRKATEERLIGELIETTIYKFDGSTVDVELYCHPIIFGEIEAIQSIVRDITSRRDVERKLKEVMNEVSTPIVPVSQGIAVLPLVGSVDVERANYLLDSIPQKIQDKQLTYLIIDLSGIYNINEAVVDFLYKINAIMKLIGISPICTGIRPELAQKVINICADFTSLKTMSTVQQALNYLKT